MLATSILALSGIAFLPEFFLENDISDKLDDGLLFLLGVAAIIWYLSNGNRFKRSLVPVILVLLGLADKIMALVIEFKDKDAVGDDFGGLILFLCAAILVVWQYRKRDESL